jgi:hypothetical protein
MERASTPTKSPDFPREIGAAGAANGRDFSAREK